MPGLDTSKILPKQRLYRMLGQVMCGGYVECVEGYT